MKTEIDCLDVRKFGQDEYVLTIRQFDEINRQYFVDMKENFCTCGAKRMRCIHKTFVKELLERNEL